MALVSLRSLLLAVLAAAVTPAAQAQQSAFRDCASRESKNNSSHTILSGSDHDEKKWRVSWSTDGCSVDMTSRGEIEFTRDLDGIQSISRGGFFEITERIGREKRKYEAERGSDGELEVIYTVNGERRPFDAEGKRWLGTLILELERNSGFAAKSRVPQILRRDGVDGVLAEVTRMSSDYVQRLYLNVLKDSTNLSDGDVRKVFSLAGKEIDSDYELASLLIAMGKDNYVKPATSAEYATAALTLQSDYERRRTYSALLKVPGLSPSVIRTVLEGASTMSSDYELASLLLELGPAGLETSEMRTAFFKAASSIDSDYEQRRAYGALIKAPELSKELLAALLKSAPNIGSDYECASLLVEIARRHALDSDLREAYIRAADSIGSDYEHRRALSALVKQTGRSSL
jgi:hypothetical protein